MKKFDFRFIRIVCIVAMVSLLISGYAMAMVKKGSAAPDFTLTSIDGKQMSLSQIRKDPARKGQQRVVILDFWATGCPPCVDELSFNQMLHKKYAAKGLAFVGIALDREGASVVKPFVNERHITYTMLCETGNAVARPYGVRYTPTIFIIDKHGVVQAIQIGVGPDTESMIENTVKSLLK